jgi:hypothetical protein
LRQIKVDLVIFFVEPILNSVFWLNSAKNGQISDFMTKPLRISVPTESGGEKKVWSQDDLGTCPGQFLQETIVQQEQRVKVCQNLLKNSYWQILAINIGCIEKCPLLKRLPM